MKQTFIILLALSGSAFSSLGAASVDITLDSKLSFADGSELSAFDTVAGKTSQEVFNSGAFQTLASANAGTTVIQGMEFNTTLTLALSDMFLVGSDVLGRTTTIHTISLISRLDGSNQNPATITLGTGEKSYISKTSTYTNGEEDTYGVICFEFEKPVEIGKDVSSLSITLKPTDLKQQIGLALFQPQSNVTLTDDQDTNGTYQHIIRISGTTSVVPEPATATLSLLALAALAGRRRRALSAF